jgi:hypothetical protein
MRSTNTSRGKLVAAPNIIAAPRTGSQLQLRDSGSVDPRRKDSQSDSEVSIYAGEQVLVAFDKHSATEKTAKQTAKNNGFEAGDDLARVHARLSERSDEV